MSGAGAGGHGHCELQTRRRHERPNVIIDMPAGGAPQQIGKGQSVSANAISRIARRSRCCASCSTVTRWTTWRWRSSLPLSGQFRPATAGPSYDEVRRHDLLALTEENGVQAWDLNHNTGDPFGRAGGRVSSIELVVS